ncbi:MAG TPA: sigma-70 family RNA polymerase sigma factor [Acidimicrobiales bacterium]|nr:sigma-70 family RNA polymerase sigma factor [Acidimicrobiales bacterium]
MQEATPGVWVVDAADGSSAAWGLLVDHYSGLLWSIARSFRLSTPDAADVIQTTWLRMVEHLGRIEQPDRIGAWLATTARNECLAALRRNTRTTPAGSDVLDAVPDQGPGPEHGLLTLERDTALWEALEGLSELCRNLLRVLASDPPPSYLEVGAALSMPVGSIGPSRARCLDQLRRRLLSDEAGDAALRS